MELMCPCCKQWKPQASFKTKEGKGCFECRATASREYYLRTRKLKRVANRERWAQITV